MYSVRRETRIKHFANVVQHPTRHIIGHCENENSRGRKVAVDWQTAQCLISDLTKTWQLLINMIICTRNDSKSLVVGARSCGAILELIPPRAIVYGSDPTILRPPAQGRKQRGMGTEVTQWTCKKVWFIGFRRWALSTKLLTSTSSCTDYQLQSVNVDWQQGGLLRITEVNNVCMVQRQLQCHIE